MLVLVCFNSKLVMVCNCFFFPISLIKMLYWLANKNEVPYLTLGQFKHAVLRNFGGTDQSDFNPLEFFSECFKNHAIVDFEVCFQIGTFINYIVGLLRQIKICHCCQVYQYIA